MVRLGATCKQLFMLTKEEAIWRPLVKQTFGMAALMYQRIAAERAEEKAGVEASEEALGREDDGLVELVHKQCCGSGSGIRFLFDPWIRDPE